ncbi:hypothetical protein ACS0TY_023775 [Phlomoides rotata]
MLSFIFHHAVRLFLSKSTFLFLSHRKTDHSRPPPLCPDPFRIGSLRPAATVSRSFLSHRKTQSLKPAVTVSRLRAPPSPVHSRTTSFRRTTLPFASENRSLRPAATVSRSFLSHRKTRSLKPAATVSRLRAPPSPVHSRTTSFRRRRMPSHRCLLLLTTVLEGSGCMDTQISPQRSLAFYNCSISHEVFYWTPRHLA